MRTKKLLAFFFLISLTVSGFGQKLDKNYSRPYSCTSCTEFLNLKDDGTYTRTVAFDWGDNNYNGKWTLKENKLTLTEKDTLKNGFFRNKIFCVINREDILKLNHDEKVFIPQNDLNCFYILPCDN